MELVRLNKDNNISGNNTHSGTNLFTGDNIHLGDETHSGNETFSGNNTHSGNNLFTGTNLHEGTETFEEALRTTKNVGTKGAATVEVIEYGDGIYHMTKLTLTNFVVGPLAGAAAAKALVPATPLYTLPAGYQIVSVCRAKIGLTAAGTAVTPEIGLGSAIGNAAVQATIGAAGATLEDYLEGFAVATTVSHAQVDSGLKTATAGVLTGIALNDPADAKTIYLNCAGTWNADNVGNLVANGEVLIVWTCLP